jgi:hypothetical protein
VRRRLGRGGSLGSPPRLLGHRLGREPGPALACCLGIGAPAALRATLLVLARPDPHVAPPRADHPPRRQAMADAFGRPLDDILVSLSPAPVAAASLGQVYRGRLAPELGGGEVAIKVRRPGQPSPGSARAAARPPVPRRLDPAAARPRAPTPCSPPRLPSQPPRPAGPAPRRAGAGGARPVPHAPCRPGAGVAARGHHRLGRAHRQLGRQVGARGGGGMGEGGGAGGAARGHDRRAHRQLGCQVGGAGVWAPRQLPAAR